MKIVVVAPRFPFPLDKGDRLTVYHLLKYFSHEHQLSLVCFLEPDQDPAWVSEVEPFCERIEMVPLRRRRSYFNSAVGLLGPTPIQMRYYADPAMHAAVRRVIQDAQPDLLYAQLIRMGQYIEPYHSYARVAAFNLSMTLNHARLAEHASNKVSQLFHYIEYLKLRSFEGEFARRFDRVLYISRHDFDAISNKAPLKNVSFIPHGVDYVYFTPDTAVQKAHHSLIITGNMNYAPNIDAAMYFYHEIFPSVRRRVTDVKLSIIGTDPSSAIKALARDPAVCVTGRVPDLRTYMNQAQIALAPIRIGAGLQNKVLEGMSMSLPMVITPVANEGIRAEDGRHVLIADSAQDFADQVVSLLNEPERRKQIGAAAREFIVQNWSWEKHFSDLERIFAGLIGEKQRTV